MLIGYKRGQTSIVLRVKILDSAASTGAGKTGFTSASSGLIISTIADNESTATAYTVAGSTIETITTLGTYAAPTATKCRFKEVDSTNHKGVYEIQIADARFAVSSAKSVLVSISGATGCAETDVVIPLRDLDPFDSVRAGLTALPNAAAGGTSGLPLAVDSSGRVDVLKVNGTSQTARDLGASVLLSSGTGTGQVSLSSGTVTVGTNSDKTGYGLSSLESPILESGTAQAGASGTITLRSGASATSSLYKYLVVRIYGGTGAGQARVITAYNGGTKVATVDTSWTTSPDATSTYAIIGQESPSLTSGAITNVITLVNTPSDSSGVTTLLSGVTVTTNNDKTGYGLSSAAVQAVWDALTSALTTVGSVGKRVADFLTGDAYVRLGAPAGASHAADIAALPTANANADALLDRTAGVETGITPRQGMRLMVATLVGKLSGAATTTVTIRDTTDAKNRVVATVDADGNRSAVTLDAS